MGPLAGVVAHGGLAGAIVEALVALAVFGLLVAVWLRERRGGRERSGQDRDGPARLKDEEPPTSSD